MKYWVLYTLAMTMLALFVWNETREYDDHHQFFTKVEEFMEMGGRNTAKHGYDLCKELDEFKATYHHHHGEPHEPKSCEEIYNIEEK